MRTTLLAGILVIGGCASQPSPTAPVTAPITAPVTAQVTAPATATAAGQPPQTAPATGQPAKTAPDRELEKQRVAEALRRGYKVVNANGEVLYCRSDFATGSHIQTNTVCLTAQKLDNLHQRIDQSLSTPNVPPPQKQP
jgi:hypothetical protein